MGDLLPALKAVFSYKNLVHAIAGATGSSVAITVFYPLDVARVRLQVDDARKADYSHKIIAQIYEEEGLGSLYRGWFPVVTSIYCSNFVYFYVFNCLKVVAYPRGTKAYPSKDLFLAFLAGVVNVVTTTPLWVANTRLKLQGVKLSRKPNGTSANTPHYTGMVDALKRIRAADGVSGLWSGTIASVILATNPAVQFMVYEALKRRLQRGQANKELSSTVYFVMGALAKMVATFVTYPVQVVQAKSRAGHNRKAHGLIGVLNALQKLAREKGLSGLYKGLEVKLTQTVLMAALMFLTYEKIAAVVFKLMRQQYAKKMQ